MGRGGALTELLDEVDDGLLTRPGGDWALDKLDYLKRYIHMFVTSMRHIWSERNYIDLFSGPGKVCIDHNEVRFGSPLLALTALHPFTGYHFVESDLACSTALIQRCSASPYTDRVHVYQDDCNQVIDQIVTSLKRTETHSLNMAFIDPTGIDPDWSTIEKLASVRRMDLIIYYPQMGLKRNLKQACGSESNTAVDKYFGTRDWRNVCSNGSSVNLSAVENELIAYYQQRLHDLGYTEVRRDDELGTEPLMRSTQHNAPLYRLIYASKHELGRKFWKEVTKRNAAGQGRLLP